MVFSLFRGIVTSMGPEKGPPRLPLHPSNGAEGRAIPPPKISLENLADKTVLQKKAGEYIKKAQRGASVFDIRQFAMMHNASFVKGSSLDNGHCPLWCLEAYLSYLTILLEEGEFLSSQVSREVLQELKRALEVAEVMQQLWTPEELEKGNQQLLCKINEELYRKGYIYLVEGYRGSKNSPGHAITYKISEDRKEQKVTISFFNLGEGVGYHPELSATSTHIKASYSYFPVVISADQWDRMAPSFIAHLMQFRSEPPPEGFTYCAQNLYDLLGVFDSFSVEQVFEQKDKLAAIPQTMGDCSERSVRNLMIDFLSIEKGVSQNDLSILLLNLRLASIAASYHSFLNAPKEQHQLLLVNACEETAKLLLRSQAILNPAEFLVASEMIEIISQSVQSQVVAPPSMEPPRNWITPTAFPAISPPALKTFQDLFPKHEPYVALGVDMRPFNAATFRQDLENILNRQYCKDSWSGTDLFVAYISTLPLPHGQLIDAWDAIPDADVTAILAGLKEVLKHINSHRIGCEYTAHSWLEHCTIYAIADKLVRKRHPLIKALPVPNHKNEPHLFFPEGRDEKRYLQIQEYFSQVQEACGGEMQPLAGVTEDIQTLTSIALRVVTTGWVISMEETTKTLGELQGNPYGSFVDIGSLRVILNGSLRGQQKIIHTWNELGALIASKKLDETGAYDAFIHTNHFYRGCKGVTVNDILCHRQQISGDARTTANSKLSTELGLLLRDRELNFGLAVQWMRGHWSALNQAVVQEAIEVALFSNGAFKAQQEEVPGAVDELRALIKSGIQFCGGRYEYTSATLFLIRLGVTLESYAAAYRDHPIDQGVLKEYRVKLRQVQDAVQFTGEREGEESFYLQALATECFLETGITEHTLDELINLHVNTLKLAAIPHGGLVSIHLSFYENAYRLKLFNQLQSFIEKEAPRQQHVWNTFCNAVVSKLMQLGPLDLSWQHDPSTSRLCSKDYIIDFHDGSIYDPTTFAFLTCASRSDRQYRKYQEFGFKPDSLWWAPPSNHNKISLDRLTISFVENEVKYVMRNLPGEVSNSLAFFSKEHEQTLPFLRSFPFVHFSVEQEGGAYILACLREGQVPFMRIDLQSTEVTACRVDDEGNALPYLLVNLQKLESSDPLYAQTVRFAPPDEILCFIDETTHEIQELYFHSLKLSFKQSQGRLMSQEFPGYYLTPLDVAALKGHDKHAMILRNDQKNIKVLLPSPPHEDKKLGFAKREEEQEKLLRLPKYYVYDLDSVAGSFRFQKTSEKLFLIYFFKTLGDYDAALEELNRKDPPLFDQESLDVLKHFFYLRDQSPRSVAFTQRLSLYIVDRLHLIPGYAEKAGSAQGGLSYVSWGYENYLTAIGDDHINGIPIEWRLTEKEEQRICFVLEREEVQLSKMIKLRMDLILSKERAAVVEFNSEEISLVPQPFQLIVPPSKWKQIGFYEPKRNPTDQWKEYPNFVSKTYCESFFAELFEKARKVPKGEAFHPFDFTLLALLRSSPPDSMSLELASLLTYVRHFPDVFQDLSSSNLRGMESACETLQKRWAKKHQLPAISKMEVVLPPSCEGDPQPLPPSIQIDLKPKPFAGHLQKLFTPSAPSVHSDHPPLFELHEDLTALEQEIVDKYTKAQARPVAQQSYSLQAENLGEVERAVNAEEMQYRQKIRELEESILRRLNNPYVAFKGEISLGKEVEFRLQLTAHQTHVMTPDMVMREVILKDSTALFDQHRPMLSRDHIKAIVGDVNRYYHLLVLSSLCSEVLTLVKKVRAHPGNLLLRQELYNALNYEFQYAPEAFPEIAYMRVKTGKLPRQEQLEVYRWVCEGIANNENRLFQLSAGGGKTSYLIPLMILRSKRSRLVPFVLTTQAMYSIEKENLKSTLHLLGVELGTLEVDMHAKLTLDLLKGIYQQLVVSVQVGKATIITPQTYYALRLGYFTLEAGQHEERELLGKILGFFKRRALFLGDESHRNYDPMTQAIYGLGDFVTLGEREQNLLMTVAKPLFGMEKLTYRGVTLSEIATSKEEGRGEPSKEDLQGIRATLAKHLLATCFNNIPAEERKGIERFLIDKREAEPSFINQLPAKERELIHLGRYFFLFLLKQVVRMKTDFDHVYSPEQGGIDAPSYYKTPSHAQFKDHCLTFLLSIKGTWHRGLDRKQFAALIAWLQARDLEERVIAPQFDQTPSQQMFQRWVQEKIPEVTLEHFDQKHFDALFSICSKQPAVVEYYLTHLVLQTVGHSSEQLTSAPTHLMDGGKCSIIFSATPLPKLASPQALKQTKRDDVFEAQVIAQSAHQNNQNFVFPADVADFFEQMAAQKSHYQQVRHMIDAGGFLCHEANGAVAQKWLEASDLDGVIYFKEVVSGYGETLCCRLRDRAGEIEFSRMDELKRALVHLGLEDAKLGVFFDAAHAESAHFDPEPNTQAFVLAGDALTLSHAIQALMRERGFLNQAINQRIIWVVQKDLKVKMLGTRSEFSSQVIHTWCLKNEAKAERMRIILAAYQDIAFRIEQHALSGNPSSPPAGLREKVPSHFQAGAQKKIAKTTDVLWQFAHEYYDRFSFSEPLESNHTLKKALGETIDQVSQRVPSLSVDFHNSAAREMHQKCHVQQQMHIVQQVVDTGGAITPASIIDHPTVIDPDYSTKMKAHGQLARTCFDTDRLTERFYLESNQTLTGKRRDVAMSKHFLKPIHFLLIVCHGGETMAEAISVDLLPRYVKGLMECPIASEIGHKAFIIRADGTIHRRGKGALAPTQEEITEVMSSQWMEDVLIDTALLNGTIPSGSRFKERVKEWPHFVDTFDKMLQAQAMQREISRKTLLAYLS